MIPALIRWAVNSRLVVVLLSIALVGVGTYAMFHLNIEAYPDPAPAIVEVITQYPGASAEEVEREVTIPLEIALAGMPGLTSTRSKSLAGLSSVKNQFEYGVDMFRARLEVTNRIRDAQLPDVVKPELANTSPTGEIYRYVIGNPKDETGRETYDIRDVKSLEDWVLEREFRRIPGIADVSSFGGLEKRYEVLPDPERLKAYGIGLSQLEEAIARSNKNVGGDFIVEGPTVQAVRGVGLIGRGQDPVTSAAPGSSPDQMAAHLRKEEQERLHEIRDTVLAATNNIPIRVGDVVEGGAYRSGVHAEQNGVVVGAHPRLGQVALSRPVTDAQGKEVRDQKGNRVWEDRPDVVQGIVLLRKGEQSLPALAGVKDKIEELNSGKGRMLPGTTIDTVYDRTRLVDMTTHTVKENVLLGIGLVTLILLVFLNHTRSALIVAINVPLALLFAMGVLYFRGKSANLLSLGAVDFGIIVDSSVIMVEAIYRIVSSGTRADLDLKDRILAAAGEVERSLFFSTIIMIFALLPLFTMKGAEGQIFGPMADTYAFALGGALILSLTLSPVLCRIFFTKVKPAKDNFLVRWLKGFYLWQLRWALKFRMASVVAFVVLTAATGLVMTHLGAEFMPELEEGNVYVRGTFPVNASLQEVSSMATEARRVLQKYDESLVIANQVGRPGDGTDPTGFYNCEINVPLRPHDEWPKVMRNTGIRRLWEGAWRPRTKAELIDAMGADLNGAVVGVDWNFSQYIRDNVLESMSGVKGENAVKIFGPDLDTLEKLAGQVKETISKVPGITSVGVFRIKGQANLEFPVDREKCARWNVEVADVEDVLATAVGGKDLTQLVEGERKFDVTLRWPERLRANEQAILDIPVEVVRNRVSLAAADSPGAESNANDRLISFTGENRPLPAVSGTTFGAAVPESASVPRRRLRDLVTPMDANGNPDENGRFVRSGASTISREQGQRLIAIKFSVRDRDLAGAVAEAQQKTAPLIKAPYRTEWSGEFEQMQAAVRRLIAAATLSLILIVVLLYLAMRSLLDVGVVLLNVVVMCIGGIWALFLTGEHFNISAGVGFISVLGVGIMNGLLLISRFNASRSHDVPLPEALREGVETLIRPLTMTALAAIFGLLPAALSTRMGSESQRPLAIVVVGGMTMTLLLVNLLPVFYSFYGSRTPPEGAGVGH